jgi:hypothetical protein
VGLFDSLYFRCPFCGESNEEQTKAGPCLLDSFQFEKDLPAWVMEDFNGTETRCFKCQKRFKFVFDIEIKVKRKELLPLDNLDYIELEYRKKEALKNSNKSAIIKKKRGKKL